ncbi:MAG: transposase [Bacteroidota bacterium]
MGKAIPWDGIVPHYDKLFSSKEGRAPISGRVIIGALIIKHIENLSDRATIQHIQENMFMQYFLGYTSFTNEAPFSDTLFVEIRKRLNFELLSKINEVIALHCLQEWSEPDKEGIDQKEDENLPPSSPISMQVGV